MKKANQSKINTQSLGTIPYKTARSVAHEALSRVIHKGQSSDTFFDALVTDLKPEDKAFARALFLGTLRHYGSLSIILDEMLHSPLPERAKRADMTLRMGLAEILVINSAEHALVNEAVDFIKATRDGRAYGKLVNAVLRTALREKEALLKKLDDNVSFNLPAWLRDRFNTRYGNAVCQDIARSITQIPALDITLKNPDQTDIWVEKLKATSYAAGHIRCAPTSPVGLEGFTDGDWWVQDLAASLPVRFLPFKSGDKILDMCSAPGGKTQQLVALGADVLAVDRSKIRMARLLQNMDRTGLKASTKVMDATAIKDRLFDHILLDAPCTALGTIRRNPDILHIRKQTDIKGTSIIQSTLLDHAFTLLKPGGSLIYAVCSLEPEEGKEQIDAFLARSRKADLPALPHLVPLPTTHLGGLEKILTPACDLASGMMTSRTDLIKGGMDGFFIAHITKRPRNTGK